MQNILTNNKFYIYRTTQIKTIYNKLFLCFYYIEIVCSKLKN